MIEKALREHLMMQEELTDYLAKFAGEPAIFNQNAPSDKDDMWGRGSQYGRIVFAVDIEGNPERTMGGVLAVDIMCEDGEQFPEDIEPIIRHLIHGYFFSNGTFTVAAQWKNSSYFDEPTDHVKGCTLTFDLLGFPVLSTMYPDLDVIERINKWSSQFDDIYVINRDPLPQPAWKPYRAETAVYWRVMAEAPAKWIPDTYHTIWRTATLKGHIFAENMAIATAVGRHLTTRLYADTWLRKPDEAPIRVDRQNTLDNGADPLRTGQMTVEATYGIIVRGHDGDILSHIHFS